MKTLSGQVIAQTLLEKNITEGKPFHAFLFVGPEGIGKVDAAVQFSCALNGLSGTIEECSTEEILRIKEGKVPDIRLIQQEGAAVKIEQMREMIRDIQIRPFERRWKIFIIQDADRMSLAAANSVLKVLEEPPQQGIIILTTAYPALILPTIRSRCQTIPFRPMSIENLKTEVMDSYGIDDETAYLIAGLSEGLPAKAVNMAESPVFLSFRNSVIDDLEQLRSGRMKDRITMIKSYERDKNVSEKLRMWATVIRDILVWKVTGDIDLLYHRDKAEYYGSFEKMDIYCAVSFLENLEKTMVLLQRNVNSGLAIRMAISGFDRIFIKEEANG